MGKLLENVKGLFSRKQPSYNQWASSSSQPGPSKRASSWRSWGDHKDDGPPAYSPTDEASSSFDPSHSKNNPFNDGGESAPSPPVSEHLTKYSNKEDPFAFLTFFDTVFIIDDSGSMSGKPWREVADVLRSITPICTSHDSDGIDLYFLNYKSDNPAPPGKAKHGFYNITSPNQITEIFRRVSPTGQTYMGMALRSILAPYVETLKFAAQTSGDVAQVKPVNIIAITDGEPTDEPEPVIVTCAGDLDELKAPAHQVGIQFFQVGNQPGAAAALQRLDDAIKEGSKVRDIVDTVSWDANTSRRPGVLSADTILKVVLGAVLRRLDRLPTVKPING
ncbi:hypothetical protein V8C35DRAFT_182897 [Trichoderma chlorosporum]